MSTTSRDETWREVAEVVDRLAELARQDIPDAAFHRELLERSVRAAGALGGNLWLAQEHSLPTAAFRTGVATDIEMRNGAAERGHAELIRRVLRDAIPSRIAPQSGGVAEHWNPTDYVLIMTPLAVDEQPVGVLEWICDADLAPAQYRGLEQLATVIGQIAGDFHRAHLFRALRRKDHSRSELDRILQGALDRLELEALAYFLVNEARRWLGCHRVSLATSDGRNARILAISGVDTIERRSTAIRSLERGAAVAAAAREANWITTADTLAEPAEPPYRDYFHATNAKLLGVCPLTTPRRETLPASESANTMGLLIVEQFDTDASLTELQSKAAAFTELIAPVVDHAIRVAELPGSGLSRWLARANWLPRAGWSPAGWLGAGGLLGVLGIALFLPVDFEIEARGALQPIEQEAIYAPRDGIIRTLLGYSFVADPATKAPPGASVAPGDVVPGDVVVEMEDARLDYELTTLLGEQATIAQRLDTVTVTLEQLGRSADPANKLRFDQLTAEKLELETSLSFLGKRLQILQAERETLLVRASIAGQIQTWDVHNELRSRPVRQGQRLLMIANPAGPWKLELNVPDHQIGYVNLARASRGDPLPVRFVLKSSPERTYQGRVAQVALSTETLANLERAVTVSVAISHDPEFTALRPGTGVIARIHCGRRSLGYVWLHDLIESVRRRFLLW